MANDSKTSQPASPAPEDSTKKKKRPDPDQLVGATHEVVETEVRKGRATPMPDPDQKDKS